MVPVMTGALLNLLITACSAACPMRSRAGTATHGRAKISAVWYSSPSSSPVRRPIIAGNWKLNPATAGEATTLLKLLAANQRALEMSGRTDLPDVAIFPPFPYLQLAIEAVSGTSIKVGAQNIGLQAKPGAFTGEVSASMVRSLGCELVLLGHSERRILFDETDDDINAKLLIALSSGLGVVLCIGESEREYEMGLLAAVCAVQLKKGLRGVLASSMDQIIIAYEPVWAIGTGKTATPLQAQEAHVLIRAVLAELYGGELARKVRIQYGGSVTPESVDDLMRMPDVDGALVGGASLVADKLSRIIEFTPPDRPLSNPRQLVAREVVACKNALGESPVWSARERMLYWISAVEREVWAWNLRDSPFKRTFESTVGSIALVDDGRLLVSCDDRTLAYDVETGASKVVARTPEPHRLTRFNDGRVDRAGQLVIGMYNHFHRGGGSSAGDDNAGLYRLSAGGFDELGPKFRVSNVICFSPDGRTLYFCDSPTRKVYAYSYSSNTSPALADRRLVYTMPSHLAGSPDGAQVDAAGGLWIALSGAGQVAQIDPETGETKMVVLLPVASPTSLTFGGDELDTLYITSRGPDGGGLYAVQMPFGVRGIAEPAVSREMVERLISSAALAAAD